MIFRKTFLTLSILAWTLSAAATVIREKNVRYLKSETDKGHLLDVYHDGDTSAFKDVVVFIHGGSWKSGDKDTYFWLGRNFARKHLVAVIVNYRLTPDLQYNEMAYDCAAAVAWTRNNIKKYGGNPQRIFVMGHSAGGHLASLIDLDPRYFAKQGMHNPICGVILNDAFGLDMFELLTKISRDHYYRTFIKTFSTNTEIWKQGSPLTYVSNVRNPYLILAGEWTYTGIQRQSRRFADSLSLTKYPASFREIPKKKHKGMIIQMIPGGNSLYNQILDFIKQA